MSDANMRKGDESSGERSRTMLAQMIALEEQKLASANAPQKLSTAATQSVKDRLLAEKQAILKGFDETPALSVAKARKGRAWMPLSIAAAAAIAVGVIFMLRQNAQPEVNAIYAQGGLKTNLGPLTLGKLAPGITTLASENGAFAVFRLGDAVTATLGQASEMGILKLARSDTGPEILLEARNGRVFFTLPKGSASLKVKTPLSEVSVTGTSFAVNASRDATEVSVLEGTVTSIATENVIFAEKDPAKKDTLPAATTVAAKQKLKLATTGEMLLSPLSADEIGYLEKLQKVAQASAEKGNEVSLRQWTAEILAADAARAKAGAGSAAAPKLTLADIRAKYGKISRVNLKSGKSYTGYFKLKGAQMEIVTPGGTVRVATAELQDVQDVN